MQKLGRNSKQLEKNLLAHKSGILGDVSNIIHLSLEFGVGGGGGICGC